MKLSEIRNRLSSSNFIRHSAPILLGATLMVSSSCSNVREFAGRGKDNGAKTEAVAESTEVEHAYTAKKSDDDFVKLLEHKMTGPNVVQTNATEASGKESVQELLAAGKDPFLDDAPAEALPQANAPGTPRVLDLASVVIPEPKPEVTPEPVVDANSETLFAGSEETEFTSEEEGPRPFVDSEFQVTAANTSAIDQPEVTNALDELTFEWAEDVGEEAGTPQPFVFNPVEDIAEADADEHEMKSANEQAYVLNEELKQSFIVDSEPAFETAVSPEVASGTDEAEAAEVEHPLAALPSEEEESAKVISEVEMPAEEVAGPEGSTEESIAFAQPSTEPEMPVAYPVEEQPPVEAPVAEMPTEEITTDSIVFDNDPRQNVGAEFCPAPTANPVTVGPHCPPVAATPFAQSNVYPAPEDAGDEYIHDGGDEGTKVYYNDYARFGLDVEDTIAEYDDDVGVAHVKPTTRATIYAPKFAAVRSATLPYTDVKVIKLAGHQDQRTLAGIDTKLVIDEKTHNDEALGIRLRTRPSGIEGTAADTSVHQTQMAQRHVKLLNAYEEIRFFREGQLARLNIAVVGDSIAAALDWNGDLGVNIYANDQAGQAVQGRFTAQDYTGVEDRRSPGDLSIVKVVDKKVARPGEVLTFTIRFENTGDRPLRNIRIVDNLSPRLVYVESSVDSDLDGKLDTEDNGRGSQILNFTFDQELKGHTGGWVSFKCRVR